MTLFRPAFYGGTRIVHREKFNCSLFFQDQPGLLVVTHLSVSCSLSILFHLQHCPRSIVRPYINGFSDS